jgi:Protein of unknown function (DUF3617)
MTLKPQEYFRGAVWQLPLLAGLLLTLGACSMGEEQEDHISGASGQLAPGVKLPFNAGNWQSIVTFNQIEVRGLSEKRKQGILAKMSKAATKKTCLSATQAARPTADFFGGGSKGDCRYRTFKLINGKADIAISCDMEAMATADSDLSGTLSASTFNMEVATVLRLPMIGKVKLRGRSVGQLTGVCAK